MSIRTQQNGRSFFNFPPEIPNIIYRELLRDLDVPIDVWQQDNPEYPGEPLRTNYSDKADPYLNCPHYKRSRPRLLRTCRHVLDEAPPSLWEWLPGVEYGTCSGVCRSGWSSVWDGRCQTQTRRPGLLFGGVAVVFFDDVCISTRPVSAGLIFSKDSPRNPISRGQNGLGEDGEKAVLKFNRERALYSRVYCICIVFPGLHFGFLGLWRFWKISDIWEARSKGGRL